MRLRKLTIEWKDGKYIYDAVYFDTEGRELTLHYKTDAYESIKEEIDEPSIEKK